MAKQFEYMQPVRLQAHLPSLDSLAIPLWYIEQPFMISVLLFKFLE